MSKIQPMNDHRQVIGRTLKLKQENMARITYPAKTKIRVSDLLS